MPLSSTSSSEANNCFIGNTSSSDGAAEPNDARSQEEVNVPYNIPNSSNDDEDKGDD